MEHIFKQGLQIPSRMTLQRSRIELDLASMIYSRRYILTAQSEWFLHLRADSSPQGGRDYFICEFDWCQFRTLPLPSTSMDDDCSHSHVSNLLQTGAIALRTRILPLSIIGSRAASAVHKGRQLLRALALDSESLQISVARTMSLMFDFGAEAGQSKSKSKRIKCRPCECIFLAAKFKSRNRSSVSKPIIIFKQLVNMLNDAYDDDDDVNLNVRISGFTDSRDNFGARSQKDI